MVLMIKRWFVIALAFTLMTIGLAAVNECIYEVACYYHRLEVEAQKREDHDREIL